MFGMTHQETVAAMIRQQYAAAAKPKTTPPGYGVTPSSRMAVKTSSAQMDSRMTESVTAGAIPKTSQLCARVQPATTNTSKNSDSTPISSQDSTLSTSGKCLYPSWENDIKSSDHARNNKHEGSKELHDATADNSRENSTFFGNQLLTSYDDKAINDMLARLQLNSSGDEGQTGGDSISDKQQTERSISMEEAYSRYFL